MGNEPQIRTDDIHHHHHHRNKSNFLPTFCRLSLHDIKPCTTTAAAAAAAAKLPADPGSPRVSCIGQVKRTNRVVGFPSHSHHHHHHHRPRKSPAFSAKTLLPNAPLPAGTTTRPPSSYLRTTVVRASKIGDRAVVVDVGELDPPLPVGTAAAASPERSIWKRRGKNGGGEIERLRVEEIKLGNHCRFGFHNTSPTTA